MNAIARRLLRLRGRPKKVSRSLAGNLFVFLFILTCAAFMSLPLVYALSNSLKPLDELFVFPPALIVRNPTAKNFTDLFTVLSNSLVPFSRYLFNTLLITTIGTAGNILIASLCAYPLAKFKLPGSRAFFRLIVLSLMFSSTVTSTPNYLIMSWLGWIDTYAALIVPAAGSTLGLYLMKQFMQQIPDSLIEAARMDGAGHPTIFFRIVMPNVKPAWLTMIVFSMQGLWNTGVTQFIYSEQLKTLPYALNQITTAGISRAGVGSAAVVVMLSLPVLVFVVTQSSIIDTMASSGMKD